MVMLRPKSWMSKKTCAVPTQPVLQDTGGGMAFIGGLEILVLSSNQKLACEQGWIYLPSLLPASLPGCSVRHDHTGPEPEWNISPAFSSLGKAEGYLGVNQYRIFRQDDHSLYAIHAAWKH